MNEQRCKARPHHGSMSDVATGVRGAIAVALLGVVVWLAACSDSPGGPDCCDPPQPLIVSDPAPPAGLAGAGGALALADSTGDSVAYVSLPPGTAPGGSRAVIRRVGDATSVSTAVFEGGFDPVSVVAQEGDSIDVVVLDPGGTTVYQQRVAVRPRRPPIVVRTDPPPDKTDVPVNASIVIVFSEPVDGGTLIPSSVQLFHGTTAAAGTVSLLGGTPTSAVFTPSAPLDANTVHRLVVTTAVRDLDGDALEADVEVEFTTGASSAGPVAAVTVSPESASVALGFQVWLRATARDASGAIASGRPITWSTDNPAVATVSVTGLVTTLAEGLAQIRADVDGQVGTAKIVVVALSVTAVTTGFDLDPDGYSLFLWEPVGGGRKAVTTGWVPANGTFVFRDLPIGPYSIDVGDVAANCSAPSFFVVALGISVNVEIDATCAPDTQIAFADSGEIHVINSNGGGRTRLTTHPASDLEPVWSPDGSRIAFTSDRDGNAEIYVMNADGSSLVRLTSSSAADGHPTWSPDGAKIAFNSDRDGNAEIYVMNADGSSPVRLTNEPSADGDPAWSPDGSRIAFASERNGAVAIYTMNVDGSGIVQLTVPASDRHRQPAWSPDGGRIAFTCFRNSIPDETICAMNADGSAVQIVTVPLFGESLERPAWSPDGHKIVYTSSAGFVAITGFNTEDVSLTTGADPSWRWRRP